MVVLILLVAVSILPPLDLLGCWIFRLDSLFVGFLFRFLIWFSGCFCLFDMDFWVVGGCFLIVGSGFLNLWWLVVVLMVIF